MLYQNRAKSFSLPHSLGVPVFFLHSTFSCTHGMLLCLHVSCSSMFSVTVEWKPHLEEVESEVYRCSLQLFCLEGGASRTDLRGVSPLVKVLDQTQNEGTTHEKVLDFLLKDSVTGNRRTVLIYCIHPQGLLDDETPSALALAQKAKCLVTRATPNRWCPRAAEQEIRYSIMDLRTRMMSQEGYEFHNTYRLAELTNNLQIVKNQSWDKRREKSKNIKDKTQSHLLPNSKWHNSDHREGTDKMKYLRDLLKQQMEEHVRDGKGNAEEVQKRVARIQQLRDALREEKLNNGAAAVKSALYPLTEDPQKQLLVLTRERHVLVLQIEALRTEAQQAEKDLQNQHHTHQTELRRLREESLQVFRVFHHVSEEQRKMSEGRQRRVLLEAVQDAIYLSAQNQQLQADNKQLRKGQCLSSHLNLPGCLITNGTYTFT
ncbi:golgin subfamily A member 6-like protein 9 isoform X4 [Antennarius striatus]|uniref:golgin subfamily A member 6-like protein 9 isoform X4 n=1 Tax=Antennarius striatus TaxID=241820 RepID=UPI0035AE3FFE